MIGRTLTHYKVVAELGAGGMGVVYKALDLRLDRHVALKILPPDKSDNDERRARFLHEARAASALNDPHIVTIFDIFTEDDGTDVLVMELVPGRTLRDVLNDGPMPVAKAVDIAIQVAEGVGTAHAAGIVHRDLKPGNVMVTDRGRVKVLDFGVAKLLARSFDEQTTTMAPTTVAGMLVGTVDYMSPEQANGSPIDARSDVFSLGAMLYEMLTGSRPFVAAHPLGVLHEILYGTIVPPRSRRQEIPPHIESAVMRALERDLARRCPSMQSLATDLRREPSSQAPEARPVAMPASPTRVAAEAPRPMIPELPRTSERPAVAERPGLAARPVVSQPAQPSMPPVAVPGGRLSTSRRKLKRRLRANKPRRRRWPALFVVLGILYGLNWTRNTFEGGNRQGVRPPPISAPRAPRPSDDRPRSADSDPVGRAIEDTMAGALDAVGRNSPALQLARAQIYWERARKDGDPSLRQKAEDTFNEVLRLKPDADVEAEAREGLRQIAKSKEATTGP